MHAYKIHDEAVIFLDRESTPVLMNDQTVFPGPNWDHEIAQSEVKVLYRRINSLD